MCLEPGLERIIVRSIKKAGERSADFIVSFVMSLQVHTYTRIDGKCWLIFAHGVYTLQHHTNLYVCEPYCGIIKDVLVFICVDI